MLEECWGSVGELWGSVGGVLDTVERVLGQCWRVVGVGGRDLLLRHTKDGPTYAKIHQSHW